MEDRGPYLIIANPTSGRGRGRRMAEGLSQALQGGGFAVQLRFTERAGDAARFTEETLAQFPFSCRTSTPLNPPLERGEAGPNRYSKEGIALTSAASGVPTIVACGGDGTVQQVASVLAARGAEGNGPANLLALAPAGRCNDFARALGVPRTVGGVLETLLGGTPQSTDLGRVNDRYFCTVATLGLDAEVTGFVDQMKLPLRGTPAYLYGAVRVLLRYRAHRIRISGDFGRVEKSVFIATTANTSTYGGAIPIVPHAVATDGTLDLCVIDAMPLYRALPFIPQAVFGRHTKRREVHFYRTKGFRLESDEPLEVWADGERLAQTPVEVSVQPGAIRIMIPSRAARK